MGMQSVDQQTCLTCCYLNRIKYPGEVMGGKGRHGEGPQKSSYNARTDQLHYLQMNLIVQITNCPVRGPRNYSKRGAIYSKKKCLKANAHFISYPQLPSILISHLTPRIALHFVFSMDESYLFQDVIISYSNNLQEIRFIKYKGNETVRNS